MHQALAAEIAGPLNPARKHGREELDDPAAYGSSSFGEHRNKRIMSGTTPSVKRWSGPSAFPSSTGLFLETELPANVVSQDDTYMDMDMQSPQATEELQSVLEPGLFHTEPPATSLASRIPTPIQPSFRNQVRGAQWEEGPPANTQHHPHGVNNMGHHHCGLGMAAGVDHSVPRTVGSEEWNNVRNRRLPSPISEAEDSPSILSGGGDSPDMVLDGGFTTHLAHRLASQVSISTPDEVREDPMANIHPEDMQRGAGPSSPESIDVAGLPTTPPQGRRGHIRSRHTINSWTWQPGMKKTFSMGYRTDCEKCRLKVPGHFNHIIIS